MVLVPRLVRSKWAGVGAAVAVFLVAGSIGAFRYADTFWLYRGFPPPSLPKTVRVAGGAGAQPLVPVRPGSEQTIVVRSPALGGRRMSVWVYLPPGYFADPTRRYPVLYLLHGHPGGPINFILVGRIGVEESLLVAEGRITPMILVMPFGSTGILGPDEEWANGVRPGNQWESYVATDVVDAIDSRYRTIATGAGRALAGLSEGGYGALNIGLHHPGEFKVLEAWSGYETAFPLPAIFDRSPALLADNSPVKSVIRVAPELREDRTFIWFYSGSDDHLLGQNEEFASVLSFLGIRHQFFVPLGRHSWMLWRAEEANALIAASEHLAHAEG